ncbi:MAK10-like protein [Tanacetum coccineum]
MENLEQAFVDYASSRIDEAGVLEVLAHAPMYNVILDNFVESLELGKNGSTFIHGEMPEKIKDPGLFTLPCSLGDSKHLDTLADLGSFLSVGIVKNVEVHIGRLKLSDDFYVMDMDKDPATPLLIGRGFLVTANVIINCARPPYYAKKDFTDYHLPGEWEIARDAELNPFKDVLEKAHLLEDKQIPSVGVLDEVSSYTLFRAIGWHLEEIHVTWAHLDKKQTRLQLYTKVSEENEYSSWRRRQKYL